MRKDAKIKKKITFSSADEGNGVNKIFRLFSHAQRSLHKNKVPRPFVVFFRKQNCIKRRV